MLTDIAVTPIAETLRALSAQRRSGDLLVRSGRVAKTVFFDHGRLVFAASNMKRDRLGESLIALGRITGEQFERVTALMVAEKRRRFGEALVEAGVMDKNEVGRSVARQVRRIVLSLFELADGAASFEERRCTIPLEFMVSLSVHRLLYEGIRLIKREELVLAGLGNLDRWVTLAEVPAFGFDPQRCAPEEREILEQSRRRATLRRLAWAPGGVAFPKLRAVYCLVASGILTEAEARPREQPIVQMETGTFLLSALQRQPAPSGPEAIRLEVEEELERSERLDRESWLKVSRTAPREELVRALEQKMERYHALLDAVGEESPLRTSIELILGRASGLLRLSRQAQVSDVLAPDEPPPAALPPRARPAPAVAGPAAADVDRLLLEGEVRMTVSDYANAVKIYERLVARAPQVAGYRARLALAMSLYPPLAHAAERQFLEALRLAPENADIHYQFGLYYKAMRQRQRAINELRTAIRLDARHKLARRELESLSPTDSALISLKKLFR